MRTDSPQTVEPARTEEEKKAIREAFERFTTRTDEEKKAMREAFEAFMAHQRKSCATP